MMNSKVSVPDRQNAPFISEAVRIPDCHPVLSTLKNGVKVYAVDRGSQDVCRIEVVYTSAYPNADDNILTHSLACEMIKEGCNGMSSADISEAFDFYGAYTEFSAEKDYSSAILYTRNDVVSDTLPLFARVLFGATFPQHEMDSLVERKWQKYRVNLEKISYVSRLQFNRLFFGNTHPYGLTLDEEAFKKINWQELYEYYLRRYVNGHFFILLAGKVTDAVWKSIESEFGALVPGNFVPEELPVVSQNKNGKHLIAKENVLQSAVRMGVLTPRRGQTDYVPMKLLNTVLGGYFGSRLMSNLREDKGFTYGIGSSLFSLKKAGVLVISSEVKADHTADTLREVYTELNRLKTERISEEELNTVKSYMYGSMMRSLDGPFAVAENIRSLILDDLPFGYYNSMAEQLKETGSEKLMELSQKYLCEENFTELVVGRI